MMSDDKMIELADSYLTKALKYTSDDEMRSILREVALRAALLELQLITRSINNA